jgi:hypothetical protein
MHHAVLKKEAVTPCVKEPVSHSPCYVPK